MLSGMSFEGYVYVIRFGEYVKIGFSLDPRTRIKALAFTASRQLDQARTEEPPVPIAAVPGDHRTEHMLHVAFHNHRAVGEYFWYRGEVKEWCDRMQLHGPAPEAFDPPKADPPMPEVKYVYVRCNGEHIYPKAEVSPAEIEESEVEPVLYPVPIDF